MSNIDPFDFMEFNGGVLTKSELYWYAEYRGANRHEKADLARKISKKYPCVKCKVVYADQVVRREDCWVGICFSNQFYDHIADEKHKGNVDPRPLFGACSIVTMDGKILM